MQKHQVRRRMRVEQNGSFADYLMLTFRALDFFFVLNFLTFFSEQVLKTLLFGLLVLISTSSI